jgi:hypothetical protein
MAEHQQTNGYDSDALNGYLQQIAEVDDELATMKGDYMQACKGPRARIKEILATAKESDINIVAFREVLARHRDARKAERRIADLEDDDRSAFELMLEALGPFADTDLGKAALDRAKGDTTLDTLG